MLKTLVLDANVLVLLTVGVADIDFVERHKRLYPTYRKAHWNILFDIVQQAPALATTTHALTEASNLLRQCAEPMRSEIMAALAGLIQTTGELTPSATLASGVPEFVRLGLTDAGFALLDPERYRVLSADLELIVALQGRDFEAVNFQTLLFD